MNGLAETSLWSVGLWDLVPPGDLREGLSRTGACLPFVRVNERMCETWHSREDLRGLTAECSQQGRKG